MSTSISHSDGIVLERFPALIDVKEPVIAENLELELSVRTELRIVFQNSIPSSMLFGDSQGDEECPPGVRHVIRSLRLPL